MKPAASHSALAREPNSSVWGAFSALRDRFDAWRNKMVASPRFQAWAARTPGVAMLARRDAERLFDLTAGFVYSQILFACVELGLLEALADGPCALDQLAAKTNTTPERCHRLLQGAAALGLVEHSADGRVALGRLGAATLGAPGLRAMIRHHRTFYQDLVDPVGLLRGEQDTRLSRFWGYVGGPDAPSEAEALAYSDLMATSQTLVAEETLRAVSLRGARRLLDVGGGAGAFLCAAADHWPHLKLALFDLPPVAAEAKRRFASCGLAERAETFPGDFHSASLPEGADAISLVRVLYDHDDPAAQSLLRRAFAALQPGGLLIISEPMSGGSRPSRAGDAYFGLYTLAMTSGRPRSASEHRAMLKDAGFFGIRAPRTARPFITSVVTARKPTL